MQSTWLVARNGNTRVNNIDVISKFARLNTHNCSDNEQLFTTKFLGEGGADAGGPYREAMSMICRDIMAGIGFVFKPIFFLFEEIICLFFNFLIFSIIEI